LHWSHVGRFQPPTNCMWGCWVSKARRKIPFGLIHYMLLIHLIIARKLSSTNDDHVDRGPMKSSNCCQSIWFSECFETKTVCPYASHGSAKAIESHGSVCLF
jgi:hypothetical protein